MLKRIIFEIDAQLHQEFKAKCVINNISIKEVLENKIKEYMNKENESNQKITNNLTKE